MQNINHFQAVFEQYLAQEKFDEQPATLYSPIDYFLGLGGKRLRPVVLLMAYSCFDDALEQALPAAFAIEVFHNFTLLHDDIMDQAPLRRGQPTVHEKYSINTAILSGDVMLVKAYEYLLKRQHLPNFNQALAVFTKTAVEVCEGQQMDLDFESRPHVTISEYLKMIELKTSVLVAAALQMGALLAGAPQNDAAHLGEFGRNLGIAFQLQDDLLDAFGDAEKFGKKLGGDIAQNKKTYLYLKALEVAPTGLKTELSNLFAERQKDEKTKVHRVTDIFNLLNIRQLTNDKKEYYRKLATGHLQQTSVRETKMAMFENFADALMEREV